MQQPIEHDAHTGQLLRRDWTPQAGETLVVLRPGVTFALDLPGIQTGWRSFVAGQGMVTHLVNWREGCPPRPAVTDVVNSGRAATWVGFSCLTISGIQLGGQHRMHVAHAATEDGLADLLELTEQDKDFEPGLIPVVRYDGPAQSSFGGLKPLFSIVRFVRRPAGFRPVPAVVIAPDTSKGARKLRRYIASHLPPFTSYEALTTMGDGPGQNGFHRPIRTTTGLYANHVLSGLAARNDPAVITRIIDEVYRASQQSTTLRTSVAEYVDPILLQRRIDGAMTYVLTRSATPTINGRITGTPYPV